MEQIANATKTAEAQSQKVEEQVGKIRELVDTTYALKKQINEAEEKMKKAEEAEAKRKTECETLLEQLRQISGKEKKTESLRDDVLRMTVTSSAIFDEVLQACRTVTSEAQSIDERCSRIDASLARSVRNMNGASVFATQKLTSLRSLVNSCVAM